MWHGSRLRGPAYHRARRVERLVSRVDAIAVCPSGTLLLACLDLGPSMAQVAEATGLGLRAASALPGLPGLSQPTTEARRTGKAIKASDTKGGGTAEEDGDLVMLLAKGVQDPGAAGLSILAGRDVEPRVWHAESGVVDGKSVAACGWRWNYRTMRLECR